MTALQLVAADPSPVVSGSLPGPTGTDAATPSETPSPTVTETATSTRTTTDTTTATVTATTTTPAQPTTLNLANDQFAAFVIGLGFVVLLLAYLAMKSGSRA